MKNEKNRPQDELENNEELLNDDETLEEDEYEEKSGSTVFQNQYVRYGVIAAGVILLLVGGWLLYSYFQRTAETQASLQLSRIRPYYEQNMYEAALNGLGNATMRGDKVPGLRSIADDNSGNEVGKVAALYTANCYLALGDFAQAERYFDIASGASATIVKMGGLAGLAGCKAQRKDHAGAASLYEDAAKAAEKIGEEDKFRFYAAYQYEKAGQKEQAIALYRTIAALPEFSEITSEARAGIVRLGGIVQ